MDIRLWRQLLAEQEVEVATIVCLVDMAEKESAIPSGIMWLRSLPSSLSTLHFGAVNEQVQSSAVNIEEYLVSILH